MAKAPSRKEEPAPEAVEGEEKPKRKGKLPLVLGLVVLLAAGGGGAWFFLSKDKDADAPRQEARPQPPKPPVFVPLDAFTVNLSSDGGEQYLQVAATLRVLEQSAADAIKQYMPELRHKTLVLLSSKKPSEIITGEGRERLAEEIRQTANNVLLAAAGRPVKPLVLDVPLPAADTEDAVEAPPQSPAAGTEAPAAEEAGERQAVAAANPAEAQDNPAAPATDPAAAATDPAAAATDPAAAPSATPPAARAAPRPATTLARAADDDPVQSVFFTSFIIQ
ncbi:MAG: flagellar basal body-associated FliL family protein [Rhodocyclaceae bacterium]